MALLPLLACTQSVSNHSNRILLPNTHIGDVDKRKQLTDSTKALRLSDRRIIGGKQVSIRRHPWQVALNIRGFNGSYLCGGTIISPRWILTAAHCFATTTKPVNVRVKEGATDYVRDGSWVSVERILVHKRYNSNTYENDIALIKLRSTSRGRAIPHANPNIRVQSGQLLEVTGWGAVNENGAGSTKLREAKVPYVPNVTCNKAAAYNGHIRIGMMCAGKKAGGVDACQGDSGGPLIWRRPSGPVLVGVVSFGEGCARKLKYGVYTRVSTYRAWIESVVSADPV